MEGRAIPQQGDGKANLVPRSVKEWNEPNHDKPIPRRVKLRAKSRANNTCQNCGVRAERGDADHIVALINGGAHSEKNLQWLCVNCHRAKSKADVALKSRAAKRQISVAGFKEPSAWSKRLEHYEYDWKLRKYVPKVKEIGE